MTRANLAPHLTRPSRSGCNPRFSRAGSLNLGLGDLKSVRLGLVVGLLSVACNSTASWAPLTFDQQVQGSDAIAVVTITGTHSATNGHYRRVATARVDHALKGVRGGSIALLFNSRISPVGRDPESYSKGEHCLMFMTQVSEGKYITFQSVFGKHLVKRGKVEISDGHGVWTQPLEPTVKEILVLLSKTTRAAQPGPRAPAAIHVSRAPGP